MSAITTSLYTFKNFTDLTESESDEVLQGRNDPHVRRWMTSDMPIETDDHQRFVSGLKTNPKALYIRVERADRFVGVYSLNNLVIDSGIGGFWITSYARDRLLSLNVVFKSISYVFENYPLDRIQGYQLFENKTVARLNALLGFVPVVHSTNPDPRMDYLELTRYAWEHVVSRQQKLLKLLEFSENRNENDRI